MNIRPHFALITTVLRLIRSRPAKYTQWLLRPRWRMLHWQPAPVPRTRHRDVGPW
jgi:hypothetical protein